MKFIKRKDFLQLPTGTIYQSWEPCVLGRIHIKGDNAGGVDFYCNDLNLPDVVGAGPNGLDSVMAMESAAESGRSVALEFDGETRDARFDPEDTVIAVWEFGDVANFIERLKVAASDGYGLSYTEGLTGFKCDGRETYVTQWLERQGPDGLPTFGNVARRHWPTWSGELLAKLPSRDADVAQGRILTCVYCAQEYPQGTPAHGDAVLTEHIKVCAKHPMREAEAKIAKLRSSLLRLAGAYEADGFTLLNLSAAAWIGMPDGPTKTALVEAMRVLEETAEDSHGN